MIPGTDALGDIGTYIADDKKVGSVIVGALQLILQSGNGRIVAALIGNGNGLVHFI